MKSRLSLQRSIFALILVIPTLATIRAQSEYDRHTAFDNSRTDNSYYYSNGSAVAPSELDMADGKFPVEDAHYVSPPNSLRLKWRSQTGGDWHMGLEVNKHYRRPNFSGDSLSLWCYSDAALLPEQSPLVYLVDANGHGTRSIRLTGAVKEIPAQKWIRVQLPFDSFTGTPRSTEERRVDFTQIVSMTFVQGLDDGKPHTLFIDDVKINADRPNDQQLPAAPTGLTAKGYDRHVDLTWKPNREPDLQFYKIFRSSDGNRYAPIGIQRAGLNRYADFVGENKSVSYRISAVDADYNESPPGESVKAATHPMSDDELLTMVQEACFRYYWEAGHPAAGMAIEILPGDENLVALGASGFGITALIVGVDRGFVTREQGAERMLKIVRFLGKADRFHGVWPHFLDGRTGKVIPYFGKYDNGGDLVETAFLIQGLLTARQYFTRDDKAEAEIRDTITRLWHAVEWDWYRKGPNPDFLWWHWSPDHGFYISHPAGRLERDDDRLPAGHRVSDSRRPGQPLSHADGPVSRDLAVEYRRGWGRTTQGDHYVNGNTLLRNQAGRRRRHGRRPLLHAFFVPGIRSPRQEGSLHELLREQSGARADQPRLLRGQPAGVQGLRG